MRAGFHGHLTVALLFLLLLVPLPGLRAALSTGLTISTGDPEFGKTFNQGWWVSHSGDGILRSPTGSNYFTGMGSPPLILEHRSFFTFHIPSDLDTITLAVLRIPYAEYLSPDSFETLLLHDVTTDARILNMGDGGDPAIHNDLGSGRLYGEVNVHQGGGFTDFVEIRLTDVAVEDLNASGGDYFSIGARIATLRPGATVLDEAVFSTSSDAPGAELHLEFAPIPEPSVPVLFLSGAALLAAGTGRRRPCRRGSPRPAPHGA